MTDKFVEEAIARYEEGERKPIAPTGHPAYEWTADMDQISGFGGDYEAECRKMVVTGLVWLEAQPAEEGPQPSKERHGVLSDVILASHPGCSGWMLGAAVNHAECIREKGWEAYCQEMRERKKSEQ